MKIKMKTIFAFLMLFLIIFSISTQYNMRNYIETAQEDSKTRTLNLKQAGFWSNFTFIHVTNLNWTLANETDWCSGSGTWGNPYLIENMVINASASPIGCGIFIENSVNVYFKISNVTIFDTTNGIKLENTNKGTLVDNILLDNIESGIYMVNCVNNTILRNQLINNGMYGLYLSSNCLDNKILRNTVKNNGIGFQDAGIYLENNCDDNEIMENAIFDNKVYGINIEDLCERNVIYNNTFKNIVTPQQNYGIRLDNDCNQNNISLNLFEDLNNYGIYLVTSDQTIVSNNEIIDINIGMYMLIAHQTDIVNNTISGGSSAILMSACDGGKIIRNYINNTGSYAIRLYINCDDNEFHDNIIKDNGNYGIQLYDPSDVNNKFYKNSFISNGIHAYDNGTTTSWNNTVIGNYWDNYTGLDLDYDNVGDTPFLVYGAANATDELPIVDHWSPIVLINNPISGSSYGTEAPEYYVLVNKTYVYSMWYMITNSSTKYYFTENDTIDQDAWSILSEGVVILTFYCRDITWTLESDSVTLYKDTVSPTVSIISPTVGEYIGVNAPNFIVEIKDSVSPIGSMWYTINYSSTKYYFTENDTIDQDAWSALNDGGLIITFFGQDIGLNIKNMSVTLTKDTISPTISIISPVGGENVGVNAPNFVVEISDSASTIYSMWYTINYSSTKYYFTINDTIDQYAWSALSDDDLIITFYAQDIALNIGSKSVALIKDTSQSPNDGNPSSPPDLMLIIIISIIVISAIIFIGIMMRVSIKGKARNKTNLSEEQLSKAQYFKDITSILTILAIHNETGLCLSKIALHEGIGLDEHLFTGFISAIGSFKNELAKQMGMGVRERNGDNIIEYNEFTITLMDGEFLRLGLVSYSSLGDLVKQKCGQILSNYEIKHINDLKNFDGEIQLFNDFEDTVEAGLDMNLNKKSIVNVKQLNKYEAPKSFIAILNTFNSRSDGFYPREITSTLMAEMNISEQEADFMVYEAHKNHVFLPIKLEE